MSDTITLTLTGMAHGGAALGRETDGQSRGSRVIFVPYALPDEEVEVELSHDPIEQQLERRKDFYMQNTLRIGYRL